MILRYLMAATILAAGSCSEAAPEEPVGASSRVPTSVSQGVTLLEGDVVGDSDHPGYTVEVPDGWSSEGGAFIVEEGPSTLGLSVWDVGEVAGHPCHWKGTQTASGSTVQDLVEALISQPLRDPTAPTDVTLAGYEGQYLMWSVPDDWIVTGDSDFKGCDDPGNGHQDFVSWWGEDGGTRWQQAAGQVDELWILDVEGQTLLVDATYTPDTSEADRQELEQVVSSLRFVSA